MASLELQVGALVRHHRKRAGLSQAQLAERIERQTGSITRIEAGDVAPSFETLASLAKALDVEVRDLFGTGPFSARVEQDDPLAALIIRISDLNPSQIEAVDRIVTAALEFKKLR